MTPKAWETRLEMWHRTYRKERLAYIIKTEPRVIQKGGKLVRTKKGPPDFVGFYLTPAEFVPVAFDAKMTRQGTWSTSVIPRHQRLDLECVWALGGLSGVALWMPGWSGMLWWSDVREGGVFDVARCEAVGREMTDRGWL